MSNPAPHIVDFNSVKVLTAESVIASSSSSDKDETKKSIVLYVVAGAVFPPGHAIANYVVFKGKSNEVVCQSTDIIEAVNAYNEIE